MARIQILELPAEHHGDDMVTPFALIIDQAPNGEASSAFREDITNNKIAAGIGARHVLVFEDTIEIPANQVPIESDIHFVGEQSVLQRHAERDEKRCEELRAESLRRGKEKLEYAERIRQLEAQLDEARQWARHGYEIGQRHCGWTDHGVAPAWLTEGWPLDIGTCEHLKKAAEYDEALTRVRGLPERPEVMDAQHEQPQGYLHGYKMATREAKRAVRSFRPSESADG